MPQFQAVSGQPFILVMGVSGSGKSSLGKALAHALHSGFVEADDHHPTSNREAMTRGEALTDDMRWPWLEQLATAALTMQAQTPVIIACSALKRSYRDFLRERLGKDKLLILHAHGDADLIRARMQRRRNHFMPTSLLDSQLATLELLEPDENGVVLDIAYTIDQLLIQALELFEPLPSE